MFVGFSKVKITPQKLLVMGGYIKRGKNKATGILDELYARICILKDKKKIIVLILLDLLAVDKKLTRKIKNILMNESDQMEIIICCTHTHSGPDIIMKQIEDLESRKEIYEYRDYLVNKILIGYDEALKSLKNSKGIELLYYEKNIDKIAASRLDPYENINNKLCVLAVKDKNDDKYLGYIVNYTCHPTVLGYKNYMYSGDIFGQAMQTIEKDQSICLLTNGAEGDVSTRFTRKEQSVGEVKRLAEILAYNIRDSINKTIPINSNELNYKSKIFKIPFKKIPSIKEIKTKIEIEQEKITEYKKNENNLNSGIIREKESHIEGLRELLNYSIDNKRKQKEKVIQIIGFKIANILFVTVPGEMTQETATEIMKNKSEGYKIILLGLADDYLGYFPTKKIITRGSYEAIVSKFDTRANDILKNKIIDLLTEMSERNG
ncbi:MAG: neutral/alkaline non-lysosomal ceramidase N-terminal domain-containing protein [Sphaerochaetaceae bacterium]|nr:neutral/alkaline non-lysosomal ceramidase N-terminal domain-containing protein [Sphaerochaetaceae bacterium]